MPGYKGGGYGDEPGGPALPAGNGMLKVSAGVLAIATAGADFIHEGYVADCVRRSGVLTNIVPQLPGAAECGIFLWDPGDANPLAFYTFLRQKRESGRTTLSVNWSDEDGAQVASLPSFALRFDLANDKISFERRAGGTSTGTAPTEVWAITAGSPPGGGGGDFATEEYVQTYTADLFLTKPDTGGTGLVKSFEGDYTLVATPNVDFMAAVSGNGLLRLTSNAPALYTTNGIVKVASGVPAAAVAGTDYVAPGGVSGGQSITGGTATGNHLTLVSNTSSDGEIRVGGSTGIVWSEVHGQAVVASVASASNTKMLVGTTRTALANAAAGTTWNGFTVNGTFSLPGGSTTVDALAMVSFDAPTVNRVTNAMTVTTMATVKIHQPSNGTNVVFTRNYALWLVSGPMLFGPGNIAHTTTGVYQAIVQGSGAVYSLWKNAGSEWIAGIQNGGANFSIINGSTEYFGVSTNSLKLGSALTDTTAAGSHYGRLRVEVAGIGTKYVAITN